MSDLEDVGRSTSDYWALNPKTRAAIKGENIFRIVAIVLLSLILVFQIANVGIGATAGYHYSSFIKPKIDQVWQDYQSLNDDYNEIKPVIYDYISILQKAQPILHNITRYIDQVEVVIDNLDHTVGAILPDVQDILKEFHNISEVFIPNQMKFAQMMSIFVKDVESCVSNMGVCTFSPQMMISNKRSEINDHSNNFPEKLQRVSSEVARLISQLPAKEIAETMISLNET